MKVHQALEAEIAEQNLPVMSEDEWKVCASYFRNLDEVSKIECYQQLIKSEYLSKSFQTLSMQSQTDITQYLMYKLPTRLIEYYVCFRSLSKNQEQSVYLWVESETLRLQNSSRGRNTPTHALFQNINKLRSWALAARTYEPHVVFEMTTLLSSICFGLVNIYGIEKINTAIEFWITQSRFTELHEFVEMVDRTELYSEYPTAWAVNLAMS